MKILIALVLNALALIVTAYIVPGFHVASFQTALLAAVVLGIINTFIKPVLMLISAPLTFLTLGLFAFVVNAIVLWMAAALVPGLTIDGWWPAILAAIVLSVISTGLSMMAMDVAKKVK